MDKSTSESFKNTNQSKKHHTHSESLKIISSPKLLKAYAKNAQIASKFMPSPELLKVWNSAMALYKSLDIAHLNALNKQIASLPKTDFQKIKNMIYENRSQIYDAVQTNIETISPNVEQSDQDNIDETLIMSEQVTELINTIDNSVEFSQPDSDKQIHIKKSDTDYPKITSIIFSIISFLVTLAAFSYDVYQSNATTKLLEKNHSEQMQATYNQTEQLENLNEAIAKISQLLEQIEEKTSSNQNKD